MVESVAVLILGAGPAGCATALGLRRAGLGPVLIADKPVRAPFRIGESATPDVAPALRRLGLSGDMAAAGHRPYHGVLSLWGGREAVEDFLHRGQGQGWHLDRAAFDADLRHAAQDAGARVLTGTTLRALARDDHGWLVHLEDDPGGSTILRARVVVDAAGRRSVLATHLGGRRRDLDGLVALAVIAPASRGLAGLSLIEPCAEGWWYAAPLPDGRAMVSLMTDNDIARAENWRDPATFLAAWAASPRLAAHVPPPDGGVAAVASFAAHSGYLERAAGLGWIAVGDALIGFDPLTSSGIIGALSDAEAAVATIGAWLAGGDPAPSARRYAQRADATISRYLRERQALYAQERRWPGAEFWTRRQRQPGRG